VANDAGQQTNRTRPTDFIALARPVQWAKGVFVLIGPAYALSMSKPSGPDFVRVVAPALAALIAFGFASSGCYVINDILDRELDRKHPRKKNRPIASGRVGVGAARVFSGVLILSAAMMTLLVPAGLSRGLLGACLAIYVLNVLAYSVRIKHVAVADTISLAAGFVLRVLGGCAAAMVEPSSWLLNVTFFLSMFLALGKRLGERRTMGDDVASARGVQAKYTDDLLRMAVVVTGVATLLSYSEYVRGQAEKYTLGFNLLWLTLLPATYGLLRCILLVERGKYDDPTELAVRDRPFQLAVVVFAAITVAVMLASSKGLMPLHLEQLTPPVVGSPRPN
jgi:decaprenyl-phosphate phosphoribosyltransferase